MLGHVAMEILDRGHEATFVDAAATICYPARKQTQRLTRFANEEHDAPPLAEIFAHKDGNMLVTHRCAHRERGFFESFIDEASLNDFLESIYPS